MEQLNTNTTPEARRLELIEAILTADEEDLTVFESLLSYINKRRTQKTAYSPNNKKKLFEGFGEQHTSAEWARRLGIARSTTWSYLFKRNCTVEEMAATLNLIYPKKTDEAPKESPVD